jgi:hydrogenase expression/formation protein HypC
MCLAIPGRIESIDGDVGVIDYSGVRKEANLSLVDAKVGEWVLVHAGYAIQCMDEADAAETLRLWRELIASGETAEGGGSPP